MNANRIPLAPAAALLSTHLAAIAMPSLQAPPPEVRRISAQDIIAASAAATAAAFPDADTVILDSVSAEVFDADGTSVFFDDTYTKVLTEKGRRSEAASSLNFDAFYTELEIIAAEIIKPDGAIVRLDLEKNASTAIDPGMMSANIYDPNDRRTTVSFPGLEVGDITRLAIIRREKKVRVPGLWFDYQTFESFEPILRYTYAVSAPDDNPIRSVALRDEIPGTLVSATQAPLDGGRTLHTWDFANVPQAFGEPSMPPLYTACQRLLLSTATDWRELSRWYWDLCKPHLDAVSDEMRDTVAALTKDVLGDDERIWRIFTWVSQNVRYMGVTTETEAPGYEPHDVSVTFGRRHGVCRDKAVLLASMLRLAGLDAFPVLIHVGECRDPDVPMSFFNHAIAGVRDAAGDITLMDATNENTAELLPAYLAGKSYLVATPEGDPLRTTDDVPAAANMLFASTTAKVNARGDISLSAKFDFTGLNDGTYRGAFARMAADRRREFVESLVRATVPGATLESFSIEPADIRDTETPLVLRLQATAHDFIVRGSGASLIDIPSFGSSIGYHNFILGDTGLAQRRFPLKTDNACGFEETFDIAFEDLAPALALPETTSFKTNGITFSQRVSATDADEDASGHRHVKSSRRLEFNLTSYPPDLYRPFKETLHRVETLTAQIAAFGQSPSPEELAADSRILSRTVVYDVPSPSSWTKTITTRRLILTYAGRRNFSEVKIPFNPAWQDVEVLEASVTAPDGSVQLVTDDEINVMDAPWVSSAPRYPAGKTLVVSLPGVEVGSVVSTSFRVTQTNAPFFSLVHEFNGSTPRDQDNLAISLSGDALDHLLKRAGRRLAGADAAAEPIGLIDALSRGYNDATLSERSGFTADSNAFTVAYSATSPKTLPLEPGLPDPSNFAMLKAFSLGDWDDYAAAVRKTVARATSPANTRQCAELAHALTADIPDIPGKIRAIRDFVATAIRSAGPSFTSLPLAASPADVTLADGYGNNLDRAALISALLFDAGIDNSIVLASPDPIQEFVGGAPSHLLALPQRGTFSVPLVEILPDDEESDEMPIYLGDTDQYATLGMTHHIHCQALATLPDDPDCGIADENGDPALDIPVKTIFVNEEMLPATIDSRTIDLKANGDATFTVTRAIDGAGADAFLKRYAEMTPELLSRHHQELAGAIAVSAKPVGDLTINTNALPYSIAFTAEVPGLATRTGNILSLELPHASSISPYDASIRRLPFALPASPCSFERLTILLPPETKGVLSSPPPFDYDYSQCGFNTFSRCGEVATDEESGRRAFMELTAESRREDAVFGPEFLKTIQEIDRRLSLREANLLVIEVE